MIKKFYDTKDKEKGGEISKEEILAKHWNKTYTAPKYDKRVNSRSDEAWIKPAMDEWASIQTASLQKELEYEVKQKKGWVRVYNELSAENEEWKAENLSLKERIKELEEIMREAGVFKREWLTEQAKKDFQ